MRSSSALADWITLSAAKNDLIFLHCSPGSVDGSCCRTHIPDTEHLRGSHLEFDQVCTTCTSMTDEKTATSPTRDRQREEDENLCGRHWKVANRLQRFRVSDGRTLGSHALVLSKPMVDMQLLLSGHWRFHCNDGRESEWRSRRLAGEHAVLHSTASPDDPNANKTVEETVGARQRGIRCLLHQPNAQRTTHDWYLDNTTHWNRSCSSGVPCRDKPNVLHYKEKQQVRGNLGVVWRSQSNWNIPQSVEEVWVQLPCKEFLVGWNRSVPDRINYCDLLQ